MHMENIKSPDESVLTLKYAEIDSSLIPELQTQWMPTSFKFNKISNLTRNNSSSISETTLSSYHHHQHHHHHQLEPEEG